MTRGHGPVHGASTVLRILDDAGLVLKADYQRQRRDLAKTRKAALMVEPSAPNQVWQLDFSEYETTSGGVWRVGGVADYGRVSGSGKVGVVGSARPLWTSSGRFQASAWFVRIVLNSTRNASA